MKSENKINSLRRKHQRAEDLNCDKVPKEYFIWSKLGYSKIKTISDFLVQNTYAIFKKNASDDEKKDKEFRTKFFRRLSIGLMEDLDGADSGRNDDAPDNFVLVNYDAHAKCSKRKRYCYENHGGDVKKKRTKHVCSKCAGWALIFFQ